MDNPFSILNLILYNTHYNGMGQIFSKNLSQNQRFCGETRLFRLTYTIIMEMNENLLVNYSLTCVKRAEPTNVGGGFKRADRSYNPLNYSSKNNLSGLT